VIVPAMTTTGRIKKMRERTQERARSSTRPASKSRERTQSPGMSGMRDLQNRANEPNLKPFPRGAPQDRANEPSFEPCPGGALERSRKRTQLRASFGKCALQNCANEPSDRQTRQDVQASHRRSAGQKSRGSSSRPTIAFPPGNLP